MGRNKSKTQRYHNQRKKKRRIMQEGKAVERPQYNTTTIFQNQLFTEYYKAQNFFETEDDFQGMLDAFKDDLPATIRVNSTGVFYNKITDYLKGLEKDYPKTLSNGVVLKTPPSQIGWYPQPIAWKMGTDRVKLRKEPTLKEIHRFLVREAKTENITRQEEVSMVPPLLLEVEPHHKVLDTCASPGSKTSQLLGALHAKDTATFKASGCVVANDADPKRAYMLHHQLKRFASPNLFVTCQDAQFFPLVRNFNEKTNELEHKKLGVFDRILADVPCSGDGTLRKNRNIWEIWDANNGTTLHPVQVMIGVKSVKLLRVGGLLVYSTCTLNPIEDEAVVAQLLRRCGGALETVDWSDKLPGLKRRSGKSTWKVAVQITDQEVMKKYQNEKGKWLSVDEIKEAGLAPYDKTEDGSRPWKSLKFFDSYEDFLAFRKEHPTRKGRLSFPKSMKPSMWPEMDEEKRKNMHLERCARIMPHDQNTGGFFVALLKKVGEIPEWDGPDTELTSTAMETEEPSNVTSITEDKKGGECEIDDEKKEGEAKEEKEENGEKKPLLKKKKQVSASKKVAEYRQVDPELWANITKHYGIKDVQNGGTFPGCDRMYFRPSRLKGYEEIPEEECNTPRAISLASESISKTFMRKEVQERLHVIAGGLPIFVRNERQKGDCNYRLNNNGLEYTKSHVTDRIVLMNFAELAGLLAYSLYTPADKDVKQGKNFSPGIPMKLLSEKTRNAALGGHHGSNILKLVPEDSEKFVEAFDTEFGIVIWNARHSISALVHENDLSMLMEQLKSVGLISTDEFKDEDLEKHFREMNVRRINHEKERAEQKKKAVEDSLAKEAVKTETENGQ